MELKIRYTWKRKIDGHIYQTIMPIECIEKSQDTSMFTNTLWEMIGRDLFVGLQDKDHNDIYHNDIMKVRQRTIGKGKNTKYKDFNIAVEYWNGGFILPFKDYGEYRFRDCGMKYCEIIGNIYENPELLIA